VFADLNGNSSGNVGAVTVNITGAGADGIINGSLNGFDVGAVTVNFNNALGAAGIAGLDIFAENDIDDITVGKVGAGFGLFAGLGDGITNAFGGDEIVWLAGDDIGDIYAQSASNTGGDGAIWLTNALSIISAVDDIGTITANNLADGSNAIFGNNTGVGQILAGGDLAGLEVNNASTFAGADGLQDIKIDVTGVIGPVSIVVAGGAAMNNSSIDPTAIGDIELVGGTEVGGGGGMINGSNIITQAPGDVASLFIDGGVGPAIDATSFLNFAGKVTGTSEIIGAVNGNITVDDLTQDVEIAGDLAGVFTINGDFSGKIDVATMTGSVVINGNALGGEIESDAAIGDVTGFGTGNQTLTLDAVTSIDDVNFQNLAGGSTFGLTIDNATSIGNVVFIASSGQAAVSFTGGANLTSMGDLYIDGNFTLNNNLGALTDVGSGTFWFVPIYTNGNFLGGSTMGSAVTGMTVQGFTDSIAINEDGNLPLNSVTFNIDNSPAWGGDLYEDTNLQLSGPQANGAYGPYFGINVNLI